jgi:hypothetical protein
MRNPELGRIITTKESLDARYRDQVEERLRRLDLKAQGRVLTDEERAEWDRLSNELARFYPGRGLRRLDPLGDGRL